MKVLYSPCFVRKYKKLPNKIKNLIENNEKIFLENPFDKRLNTHKLTGKFKDLWSFSVDYKYRIVFEFIDKNTIHFHSVGNHQVYQ